MDGGTLGMGLISHIAGFERVLVIDAVHAGEQPGTLIRLEGKAIENMPGKPSVHQLGFADLMISLRLLGETPPEVVVLGVEPKSTEWSTELTPPVEASLDKLTTLVIDQLRSWN